MKKRILITILSILGSALLIANIYIAVKKQPNFTQNFSDIISFITDDTEQIDVSSLSEEEREAETQKIYDKMVTQLGQYETEVEFNYDCSELVFEAYRRVFLDCPEYFWLTNVTSYEKTEFLGETKIVVKPKILIKKEEMISRQKKLDKALEKMLGGIPDNATDYEKVLYVHDYIITNADYDHASGDLDTEDNKKLPESFYKSSSAYGALVDGKTICAGYSAAFQLAMDKLGIECERIDGEDLADGIAHEWNYVKLDGEFYYLDLTWDDPVYEGDKSGKEVSYDYFLINEAELTKTHKIGEDQTKPECTATKYNYYVLNNLYVENYSFSAVSKIITDNIDKNEIIIKFASAEDTKRAYDDMFEKNLFWNILAVKKRNLKEVYTSSSEDKNTVTITLSK